MAIGRWVVHVCRSVVRTPCQRGKNLHQLHYKRNYNIKSLHPPLHSSLHSSHTHCITLIITPSITTSITLIVLHYTHRLALHSPSLHQPLHPHERV